MIGIDKWAYRRNHRYDTNICDLERRRVVALLPDREQATAERGCVGTPISALCRVTGVATMARLSVAHCPNAVQLPIAGTSWRTPVPCSHLFP